MILKGTIVSLFFSLKVYPVNKTQIEISFVGGLDWEFQNDKCDPISNHFEVSAHCL